MRRSKLKDFLYLISYLSFVTLVQLLSATLIKSSLQAVCKILLYQRYEQSDFVKVTYQVDYFLFIKRVVATIELIIDRFLFFLCIWQDNWKTLFEQIIFFFI